MPKYPKFLSDTKLRTLQYVIDIADGKSATKLAEEYGVETGDVTEAVRKFNKSFGADLIVNKQGMTLDLNHADLVREFVAVAGPAMAALEQLYSKINTGHGHVKIHVSELLMSNFFLEQIKDIEHKLGGITLNVTIASGEETRKALLSKDTHVAAIFGEELRENDGIVTVGESIKCPIVAVCKVNEDHALAAKSSISASELFDYDLALPPHYFTTWKLLKKLAPVEKTRFYQPNLRLNSLNYIKEYIRQHGNKPKPVIGVLPHLAVWEDTDLKIIPIEGARELNSMLHLCTQRNRELIPKLSFGTQKESIKSTGITTNSPKKIKDVAAARVIKHLEQAFSDFIKNKYRELP